ncbi:hypothetical protein [Bradyrhizobium sp. USDA 4451]
MQLLHVDATPGDVGLAIGILVMGILVTGIIGALALFLGMRLSAWTVDRTATLKTSPAGVANLTGRISCAH